MWVPRRADAVDIEIILFIVCSFRKSCIAKKQIFEFTFLYSSRLKGFVIQIMMDLNVLVAIRINV